MIKETNICSVSDENTNFAITSKCLVRTADSELDHELEELRKAFPNLNVIGINSEAVMGHDQFPGIAKVTPSKINQINYEATFYDSLAFMDSSMYTFISVKN
jgi:hypothetical protein